ncbi:MAG: hypothetical protein KME15_20905, partial [Drouetiella hepatica Uher 2000/2452]|nr:hypothetical protein [Drouetiella hepatica Uher 2000/2452]
QLNWNDAQNSGTATSQFLQKNQRGLIDHLNNFWQRTLAYLNPSSEPRVWQIQDAGKVTWNAYDPTTRESIKQVSVQELRVWLEELHYQNV